MKRILITTLLTCLSVPPAAFGGIGDTYYCDEVERVGYARDAIVRYKTERFTFRWNKDEIVFGKGSVWSDFTLPIRPGFNLSRTNKFVARGLLYTIMFADGRFRSVYTNLTSVEELDKDRLEAQIVIANCSKFDD